MRIRQVMWGGLAIAAVSLGGNHAGAVLADQPTADDMAALRAAIEDNFAAQTAGDVAGVMRTISPLVSGAQRADFEKELRECMKAADL